MNQAIDQSITQAHLARARKPALEAAVETQMRSRKNQCKKFRAAGVAPSPGYVIFNQINVPRARTMKTQRSAALCQEPQQQKLTAV